MVTKSYSINKDTEEQLNYIHSMKDLKYSDIIRRAVDMYYQVVVEENSVPNNIYEEVKSMADTSFGQARNLIMEKFGADMEVVANKIIYIVKQDEKTRGRILNIQNYVKKIAHKDTLVQHCFRYHGRKELYDILTGDLLK